MEKFVSGPLDLHNMPLSSREEATTVAGASIGCATIAPVIFTDQNGGPGEYPAPANGATYLVNAGVPAGATIIAAWYTILQAGDTIQNHLAGFNLIDVAPAPSGQVSLNVVGIANTSRRLRIKIYSLYTS
jgi:hypothetical protein